MIHPLALEQWIGSLECLQKFSVRRCFFMNLGLNQFLYPAEFFVTGHGILAVHYYITCCAQATLYMCTTTMYIQTIKNVENTIKNIYRKPGTTEDRTPCWIRTRIR